MKRLLALSVSILIVTGCFAQQTTSDSLISDRDRIVDRSKDTVLIKSYAKRYNPRKALLYAAVLPGAGQVYTKKYWKIPLVLGGLGATTYSIGFYQNYYTDYKTKLFTILNGGKVYNKFGVEVTEASARTVIDKARRQRDFMIIIMGLVYVLQMVDAHVDAHLKEFDLNPNLHVRLQPTFENDQQLGRQTGLALTLRF